MCADLANLTALQEVLASVKETQQSQDFMATQAQAQQLQEQLTQQQQSCEAALADEQAKDHAYRYVQRDIQVSCQRGV